MGAAALALTGFFSILFLLAISVPPRCCHSPLAHDWIMLLDGIVLSVAVVLWSCRFGVNFLCHVFVGSCRLGAYWFQQYFLSSRDLCLAALLP